MRSITPGGIRTDLILWRHAEAQDSVPGRISDTSRALTARGHAQASRVGTWLNQLLPQDLLVFASPATRTVQTASAIGRHFTIDERVGLSASVSTVLDACAWPAPGKVTLVVGHQPTLGEVAGALLGRSALQVTRGSIVWLRNTCTGPMLHLYMSPENIPEK